MTKIPMTGDLNENATVLKFAFNIYGQSKAFNSNDFYRSREANSIHEQHHLDLLESVS